MIFALNNNQTEKLTGGYYWTFYWPATNVAPAYQMNPVPIYTTQWWNYSDNFISVLKRRRPSTTTAAWTATTSKGLTARRRGGG